MFKAAKAKIICHSGIQNVQNNKVKVITSLSAEVVE